MSSTPVLLSDAWQRTLELHPTKSMKGNIDAIAKLAIAYFFDIPVSTISKDRRKIFLCGCRGSKNRTASSTARTVSARISRKPRRRNTAGPRTNRSKMPARRTRGVMAEILRRSDLSAPEKRALLAERLTPRPTLRTIHWNRDELNRLFRGATDLCGQDVPEAISNADRQQLDQCRGTGRSFLTPGNAIQDQDAMDRRAVEHLLHVADLFRVRYAASAGCPGTDHHSRRVPSGAPDHAGDRKSHRREPGFATQVRDPLEQRLLPF